MPGYTDETQSNCVSKKCLIYLFLLVIRFLIVFQVTMSDRNEFIFKDYLSSCCRSVDVKQISEIRQNSAQEASIKRKDSLNNYLSSLEQSSFVAHKNFLSTYTSNSHIDRHLRRDRSNQSTSTRLLSSKRPRQPEVPMFKWL